MCRFKPIVPQRKSAFWISQKLRGALLDSTIMPTLALVFASMNGLVALTIFNPVLAAHNEARSAASYDYGSEDWLFVPIGSAILLISWLLTRCGVPETKVSGIMMVELASVYNAAQCTNAFHR